MAKSGATEKEPERSLSTVVVEEVKDHGKILGGTVGLLWIVQLVNAFFGQALNAFGIVPRSVVGLRGILFAPFLHGSWAHLIANTVPLLVLAWITMLRRKRDFFYVSAISGLVSGLGVWLFAATHSLTVGASGVIFGLLGFLLSRGIFERKLWPILGGVAALFLYGGALQGILPGEPGISWQAHLFGLIGGILAARLLSPSVEKTTDKPKQIARVRVAPPSSGDKPRLTASKPAPSEADEDVEAELEALRRRV